MTSAQFKLDTFEGPLDLLLHLINKHKLNIYDIEIASLLEQYLAYINNLDHEDYEDAADFLEMAARLIYIKTCSLLPQDEETQELKKELEGRIIEYSLCKKAAQKLREQYVGGEIFVRKPVKLPVNKLYTREHNPQVLCDAYMGISEKARGAKPLKAEMFEPIVSHKIVSVTSKIFFVLKKLYNSGEFDMLHLYDGMKSKSEKVATFLAVLELTKSGRIFLNDDNSKMFFNQNSRRKKITSDFDKSEAESYLQTEVISEQTDEVLTEEPCKTEIQQADIPDDVQPFENIENEFSNYEENYNKSKRIHYKNVHKSLQERVKTKQYSVVVSVKEIYGAEIGELAEIKNKNDAFSDEIVTKNQEIAPQIINENTLVDDTPVYENTEDMTEIIEELKILSKLSSEPPETVIKPNYWLISTYRWGNSPVGDDKLGNFWKFGYNRVRK